jgi:hypothetical protein
MRLLKHNPIDIPFECSWTKRTRLNSHNKWFEEHGFTWEIEGYCPLRLEEDKVLQGKFKCPINLVGTGPSLDKLKKEQLKDYPIIAINEAALYVKNLRLKNRSIYNVRNDDPKTFFTSINDNVVVPHKAAHLYVMETKKSPMFLSSIWAIRLARYFGATELILFGFDSLKGIGGYADGIFSHSATALYSVKAEKTLFVLKEEGIPWRHGPIS